MIVDREDLFSRLVNTTLAWPSSYRDKLQFSMHDIWYPEVGVGACCYQQYRLPVQERRGMRDMYRLCATERLFIPDMFPDMEKAIFMDTDLIFLRCQHV